MTAINIDRGESVSLGFEINGIDIVDIIDFAVFVGANKFSVLKGNITQDGINERLFFIRIPSDTTYRLGGNVDISYSVTTELLGVYKENRIGVLVVGNTNENTSLPNTAEFIKATFIINIDASVVTTDAILLNIYKGAGIQGLKGGKGDKGDTGEQGIQGIQGIQGVAGVDGITQDISGKVDKIIGYSLTKNDFTDTLKAKLDSITEIFTTYLKSTYDSAKSNIDALLLTGSRLITTGEITKLNNTSGTNTGDQIIPTTLPASDVYAWAKASVKPSYSTSEISVSTDKNYVTDAEKAKIAKDNPYYIYKNRVKSTVITGTTAETVIGSAILIPANTFDANDMMKINVKLGCSGSNTKLFSVKFNTTGSFGSIASDGYLFDTVLYGSNVMLRAEKEIIIRQGNITFHDWGAGLTDLAYSTAPISYPFNPAINNYIYFTFKNSVSTDTAFIYYSEISK